LTTSDVLLEALQEAGISVIFANLGSDHPGLIEALAKARARGAEAPAVVICPHEMTAMSAAHGYALATGRTQAVFVHTDVGTANLGGSVHNAARSNVPVFVFAGLTPYTLEGELPGTRNTPINHLQDVHDQHAIVRPYVKWSYDVRTGANVKQLVFRALQIAESAPCGPVYMTAAREVLAEEVATRQLVRDRWRPIAPIPASTTLVSVLLDAISLARFPLLIRLAETVGLGVVETTPTVMNFPAGHPLHLGYSSDDLVAQADLVIAIDTVSPWIISRHAPDPTARIFFIDSDPLKEDLPLWYMESDRFVRAESEELLGQLLDQLQSTGGSTGVPERIERFTEIHDAQRAAWAAHLESASTSLTPEAVCWAINRLVDEHTVIVNEAITNSTVISRYVPRDEPETMFASGGTSLGWSGGGALGIKMARPERTVISLVGDGTYFFTVPASTYWVAEHYSLPFLTVIFDNGGWNATKQNLIRQYPAGAASSDDRYWVNLAQSADLAGVAQAAGHAFAATVSALEELEPALTEALACVRSGQSAVVCVRLDPISRQPDDVV
jgi:acetolactate synthase-1/2/3 large subunit